MIAKLSLLLFFVLCRGLDKPSLSLEQVLIFSRHNVRTPIASELSKYTPKAWPKLDQRPGDLTEKGYLLEGYMGEYFIEWFKCEKFFRNRCPSEDHVYVFANSVNRTAASAEAFVKSAFKGCDITVHRKYEHEQKDPMFSSSIRNTSIEYKNMVISTVNKKINEMNLTAAFSELNKILNIKNSEVCKTEKICDLTDTSKHKINYVIGEELWVFGPLFIANSVIDAFNMNFYNGLPLKDVAWGCLKSPKSWKLLSQVTREDQNIRYRTVADDISKPLLNYLIETFLNYKDKPKLMVIMGHDYNLRSVFHTMGFKSICLPNQYELFPIGGKIVFQRWADNYGEFLKVEYIYASWSQIRNGTKLSMEEQPQRVLLKLKWCEGESGFCPWKEFLDKLSSMQ